MNNKKLCFIICVNDNMFFSECCQYIERLEKPEGMEIELIEVRGAFSMTAGYNEGMKSSDAKYKIYMHQDVFIRNKYFIYDILNIFAQDDKIGLIGLVGSVELPVSAVMWYGERVMQSGSSVFLEQYRYSVKEDGYWEVEAVDGLLMVTQYDIPWREDLFDGWDYYDISQCFEMKRADYRVVVPRQRNSWFIHDDKGVINLWNHDKYRQCFLKEYSDDMNASKVRKGPEGGC